MTPFYAIMAAIGMLSTAFLLSWPVYWLIINPLDVVINRVTSYIGRKALEWDSGYRD